MRLLWLVRYPPLPPANGGDAVYSRNLIEHTAKVADVHVLTFARPASAPASSPGLTWQAITQARHSRLLSVLSPLPNIAYRHRQARYERAVLELAPGFDAIVVDHIGLAFLVPRLRSILGTRCPPVVLVHHDHEASLRLDMARAAPNPLMRLVLHADARKAGRLERAASVAADGITAITTTDREAFAADAPATPCLLLMPGYDGPIVPARRIDDDTPPTVCILGGRGSFHKRLVLRRILDRLVATGLHQRMRVEVVGGEAGNNPAYPGIRFLGYVEDIAGYMSTVRLGLIPDDVGGGFKVRALTHVFLRVPMLALNEALRGMTLRPDVDYLGVDSIEALVDRAPACLPDTARLNAVQDAAFEHCRSRFSWDDRAAALLGFIDGLAARRGRAATGRPAPA